MTGGRVLDLDAGPNAEKNDLWSKKLTDGSPLNMPFSSRPIWLLLAVLGIGMFLADVGVRRVRIDIPAMARAVRRAFGRGKVMGSEQMGSLKAARDKAKLRISSREMSSAERASMRTAEKAAEVTAKVKFEAAADQLKKPVATIAMGGPDARPEPIRDPRANEQIKKAIEAGEGMSRLMQAKKKAREDMQE